MILNKNLKNMVVEPNETINRVIKFIQKSGFNGVFVSNKDKKIIGIITDADIRKIFLQNKLSNKLKARDVMNKNFLSISQQENEEDYFKILINSEKVIIPILQNKKLINFIHINDLKFKKKIIKSKSDKKKILVIGGLGYIGSVLVGLLLKNNYRVNILDINFYGSFFNKKFKKNKNLNFFIGDCYNKKIISKAIKGCSDVVHLGEIVGDPAVNLDTKFSIRHNYENTNFVITECIKNNINKFIFASSCSVYGSSKAKCNEKSKLNPVSLYAKCKIESEKAILSFKSGSFCPVVLRLSTVYGDSPRKRFDLVVNRFAIMSIIGKHIGLYGGSSWRPFISVKDVSRAILKTLKTKNEIVRNEIFNVGGTKENYKIIDIINILKKYINLSFSYEKKINDRRNYKVSFKKIEKKMLFKTKDKLEDVIKDLVKKYKKLNFNPNNDNFYNDSKIRKILMKK